MLSLPFDRPELVTPQLVTVVSINLSLSLLGFALAVSLWQVRSRLSQLADTVSDAERRAAENLPQVPHLLRQQHQQIHHTRDRYRRLLEYLSLLQQLLKLSRWLLRLTRPNNRLNPSADSSHR